MLLLALHHYEFCSFVLYFLSNGAMIHVVVCNENMGNILN